MMARGTSFAWGVALAGLLLGQAPALAEKPELRAARKIETEQQIAKLEERIEEVQAAGGLTRTELDLVRRHAELARKLLKLNNTRGSKAMADQAGRILEASVSMDGHR